MILYSRWNCQHTSLQNILDSNPTEKIQLRERHRIGKYMLRMHRFRFYDVWLRNRIKLFETFTYPSVIAQTDQDFEWRGLVHKDSPEWFIKNLKKFDRMDIHLVDFDTDAEVKGEASINLDTDDALSRNFIEQAKKIVFEGETVFSHGLKYRVYTDFWMDTRYDDAHFNMIQHTDFTVLNFLHGRAKLPKNIVKTKDPRWVQVIHEKNIANKLNAPYSRKKGGPHNMGQRHAEKYFEINYEKLSANLIADYTTPEEEND